MKVAGGYGLDPREAWCKLYKGYMGDDYHSYNAHAESFALAQLPWTAEQIGVAMDEYLDNAEHTDLTIDGFIRSEPAVIEHELLARGYWYAYHAGGMTDNDLLRLCWDLEDAINTDGASDLANAERELDSALIRLLG